MPGRAQARRPKDGPRPSTSDTCPPGPAWPAERLDPQTQDAPGATCQPPAGDLIAPWRRPLNIQSQDRPIFLWAAIGGPSVPPDRIEVVICPRCGALIAVDSATPHAGWHARREDDRLGGQLSCAARGALYADGAPRCPRCRAMAEDRS